MKQVASLVLAQLLLAGCTVLYSTPATWTNAEAKLYQFTAQSRLGFTGRKVYIFCNGQKLMSGKAHYWSKRITMTAELDGKQVSAECGGEDGPSRCVVSVSGHEVANLKF
jgi:hypothetical protein